MSTPTVPIDPARAAENRTAQIVGVTTAFNVVALLITILRTYTRVFVVHSFGPHDAFMILAALCSLLGGTVTMFMQVPYGLGHHSDTLSYPDRMQISKLSFVQSMVPLIGGLGFLKIAIAFELRKLRSNSWAWYNILLWCLIAFVSAYTFMAWMTFFLYCSPIEKIWNFMLEGKCYDIHLFVKFGLINTGFNIFTDVAFATLPIPVVWTLKMPLKTRLYVIAVLSLGYCAVAMGVVKATHQIRLTMTTDTTYTYDIQFWGLLQLNIGIIAACAPSLKPLLKTVLNLKSLTPRYGYTNSQSYHNQRSKRRTAIYTIGGSAAQGYTKQTSKNDNLDDFELKSNYPSKSSANQGTSYTATVAGRDDSSSTGGGQGGKDEEAMTGRSNSQDIILPIEGGKIVRTTEVSVTY
ncbi:unnamed protein product [Clonostachys rhizophaga]|uniref:Rhodopsin domain-containing protein n=1 Tax=Clonostachys rhizophaga TaxID=160324 RepID=A0A9N9VH46_9HYPO|nr:unnamed protein product [Clonostachys rhizophaga]